MKKGEHSRVVLSDGKITEGHSCCGRLVGEMMYRVNLVTTDKSSGTKRRYLLLSSRFNYLVNQKDNPKINKKKKTHKNQFFRKKYREYRINVQISYHRTKYRKRDDVNNSEYINCCIFRTKKNTFTQGYRRLLVTREIQLKKTKLMCTKETAGWLKKQKIPHQKHKNRPITWSKSRGRH